MLSRLALRKVSALSSLSYATQIMTPPTSAVHFPRLKRAEYPGKVRFGFVPEEWFTFFYPKTGVTGPYMFGIGVGTFLFSKEFYVIEHQFFSGCSLFLIMIYATKRYGPMLAEFLDKDIKEEEDYLNNTRVEEIAAYEDYIDDVNREKWRAEAQALIMEAKKINILIQLEAEYRARMNQVYSEVKKRLDFQVEKNNVERQIEQRQMVEWIIDNVKSAFTPELEKLAMQMCIKDLQSLAATAKA